MSSTSQRMTLEANGGELLSATDAKQRVAAIDVVRGLLVLLAALTLLGVPAIREWPLGTSSEVIDQLHPSLWDGCQLADLIAPGFIFILGICTALSIDHRTKAQQAPAAILFHLLKRSAALFLIGFILENGNLILWPEFRWLGVFQRLAICNLAVGLACLYTDRLLQLVLALLILANYGATLEAFTAAPPTPPTTNLSHRATGQYSPEHNAAAYVDQMLLPGRKYFGSWDSQGLLTTLPALALALLGSVTGSWLFPSQRTASRQEWDWTFLACMALGLTAGVALNQKQAANSYLLTPSFVLIASAIFGFMIHVTDFICRLVSCSKLLRLLKHAGQHSLILMCVLYLYSNLAFLVNQLLSRVGPVEIAHPQTLLAIWGLAGLTILSFTMSRRGYALSL